MPRTKIGRASKARTAARKRRRMIASASLAAIVLTLGLGGWRIAKAMRSSRPESFAAIAVKPAVNPQTYATATTPVVEILPMPMLVEATTLVEESEFLPIVPDEGPVRGELKRTPRGFTAHTLARRIDQRDSGDLQKELANATEVGLSTTMNPTIAKDMADAARRAESQKKRYAGSVILAKNRPELAGLPFRVGRETHLYESDAQNMNDMSKQFREAVAESAKDPRTSAAPDVDRLQSILKFRSSSESKPGDDSTVALVTPWRWNRPEVVPCIQQMLQAEGTELRRMSCELLREIDSDAATEALVKWAVFDTDSGNRAAAVQALRTRDRQRVGALLAEWVRYPWPRAVEHACEAMVELELKESLPQLAAMLAASDPDAPFEVDLPGTGGGVYKREVVRVNHLRNCLMCHPASFKQTELVRGGVPDENSILPPASTPAYYNSNSLQVTAATTYLKQDFSLMQNVRNSGKWPAQQRFDFFVSTKQVEPDALRAYRPNAKSPYKEAIRFAIREIAGPGKDWDSEWLAGQRAQASPGKDRRFRAAAQTYALRASPEAFIAFRMAEFQTPIYEMNGTELVAMFGKFSTSNPNVLKGTMIAYLEPLSDHPEASEVKRIQRLLAIAKGSSESLPEFLRAIADGK